MDWSPLWISLKVAVVATTVTLVTGVAAAHVIRKMREPVKSVVDGLCTLPMVLPPTVLGFLLLILFGKGSPVGRFLSAAGIRIVFSWWGAVIAASAVSFPLMYRSVRAVFDRIDPSIIYAARTLGLSQCRIFLSIILPLSRNGIAAGIALSFARALGEFGATLMIAGNIPGETATIPVAIYFASEGNRFGEAFLWVLVILSVSFITMTVLNFLERRHA